MTELLPSQLDCLSKIWVDNANPPINIKSVGRSVATWLANGFVNYQNPKNRNKAFEPISYLVGTDRKIFSYIGSLVQIFEELSTLSYNILLSSRKSVLIGEVSSTGVAQAPEIIVNRLKENKSEKKFYVTGLEDSLSLIQSIKPKGGESFLYKTWVKLNKKEFDELKVDHPWGIEHAFILACYSYCNLGNKEVGGIINDLRNKIKDKSFVPSILEHDLWACEERLLGRD